MTVGLVSASIKVRFASCKESWSEEEAGGMVSRALSRYLYPRSRWEATKATSAMVVCRSRECSLSSSSSKCQSESHVGTLETSWGIRASKAEVEECVRMTLRMARKTWYRDVDEGERTLKMVVRFAIASAAACCGEEVMGCWRYWHRRAKSWSTLED